MVHPSFSALLGSSEVFFIRLNKEFFGILTPSERLNRSLNSLKMLDDSVECIVLFWNPLFAFSIGLLDDFGLVLQQERRFAIENLTELQPFSFADLLKTFFVEIGETNEEPDINPQFVIKPFLAPLLDFFFLIDSKIKYFVLILEMGIKLPHFLHRDVGNVVLLDLKLFVSIQHGSVYFLSSVHLIHDQVQEVCSHADLG